MTTKLSKKPRIPIPDDLKEGDVLVTRGGERYPFEMDDGSPFYPIKAKYWYDREGSASGLGCIEDIVAIVRKQKPKKARPDKDAAYLAWMAESHPILCGPAQIRRIRAIAKRLNGGVAP